MNKSANEGAFAVWITGLPASGKSTITTEVRSRLEALGLHVDVLESDAVRRILTPAPTYSHQERDLFYRALAWTGSRLVSHGVAVIFDATANRRAYRDFARSVIPDFIEVEVECPLEVCMQRDRKGTYRKGMTGDSHTVPGLHDPYEAPLAPEIRLDSNSTPPERAADLVFAVLREKRLIG